MVVVTGKIRGKARPRICRGHAFTPKDTVQYEKLVRECYKEQDGRYIEGSIKVLIIAYYKIPKSYSKKRVQAIRDGLEKPTKKPDADNIAKIILDSLNGIAYKDDSQIVDLSVIKRYTEDDERVEFNLI
ncbi:TPA: RusA family crossover junction endodeoxyribonuclease [Clostridium perfringens]|nr:RusA family crossover junction endodeoxyribonuclease [Clostridium perfringens]